MGMRPAAGAMRALACEGHRNGIRGFQETGSRMRAAGQVACSAGSYCSPPGTPVLGASAPDAFALDFLGLSIAGSDLR